MIGVFLRVRSRSMSRRTYGVGIARGAVRKWGWGGGVGEKGGRLLEEGGKETARLEFDNRFECAAAWCCGKLILPLSSSAMTQPTDQRSQREGSIEGMEL